jgi:formyl-CoA transferase
VLEVLDKADVPSGKIYSVADIVADMQYQARGMVERHKLGDKEVLLPGIVPKMSATPGTTRWIGPKLGEHTDEVLRAAGFAPGDLASLRQAGIINR